MDMITDSGWVNLLSGQNRRYRVGFGPATRDTPVKPLGRGASRLGRAGHTRAVRPAGPRRRFGPKANFK
jgi:hypothetical protein